MDEIIDEVTILCYGKIYACCCLTSLLTVEFKFGNAAFLKFTQVMPVPATHTGFA